MRLQVALDNVSASHQLSTSIESLATVVRPLLAVGLPPHRDTMDIDSSADPSEEIAARRVSLVRLELVNDLEPRGMGAAGYDWWEQRLHCASGEWSSSGQWSRGECKASSNILFCAPLGVRFTTTELMLSMHM